MNRPLVLPEYQFQAPTLGPNDFDDWVNTQSTTNWFAAASWRGKVLKSTNYRRLPVLYHDGWNAGQMSLFGFPDTPDDDAQVFFGDPFPNYPGVHWGAKNTLVRQPACLVIAEDVGTTGFGSNAGTIAMLTAIQPQLAAKRVGLFRINEFERYLTAHLPADSAGGAVRSRAVVVDPEKFRGGNVLVVTGFTVGPGAIQFLNYVHVDGAAVVDTNYPMLLDHAAVVAATIPRFQSFQMVQVVGYEDPALGAAEAARWAAFAGEVLSITDGLTGTNTTLVPVKLTEDPAAFLTPIILAWLAGLPN